jgi:hypothetical protein
MPQPTYSFSTTDRQAGLSNNDVSDILQDQIDCPRFTTKKSHGQCYGQNSRTARPSMKDKETAKVSFCNNKQYYE